MKYTYLYAFICNIIIVAFMVLLVCNVYSQEKKRDRYTTEGEQNKRDTTIKTAWQGVRYAGAITIPYIPFYVWMVSWFTREYMTERGIWINSYLIHIFSPLVGFFNGKKENYLILLNPTEMSNLTPFQTLIFSMCLFLSKIQDN